MPSPVANAQSPAGTSAGRLPRRRFWAAVLDVWVLPWVVGIGVQGLVVASIEASSLGAVLALPMLVLAEARTGRTPGKALTGLRTQQVGGGPVGAPRALQRRWWMALPGLGLIPGVPEDLGDLLLLAVVVSLVLSVGKSPDGRGWHDRHAGTAVVSDDSGRPSPLLVALGVVVALLMVVAGWWLHTPAGGSAGFHAFPDADRIRCDLTHDGWLYPRDHRIVMLEPAQGAFTGRFGPNDVTLAFVDRADGVARRRGLEIQVATRSLGVTTGDLFGTYNAVIDTTSGPGLGELRIACTREQDR